MQHMLTVNVLMALAFMTSLASQTAIHDAAALVRAETEKVQGVEAEDKEAVAEIRRQEIEAKRLEIEQKNAAKRAAVTEKLSGKRAEQCEAKQEQINRMLDDRSEAAKRHYETFNTIQQRLSTYAESEKLDIEYDSALSIIIMEAEDKAKVAVENLEKTDFACATADANAPGAIIKEQVADVKNALNEYRSALRNYADAIKAAADAVEQPQAPESSTDSQGGDSE